MNRPLFLTLLTVALGVSACVTAERDRREQLKDIFRRQVVRCYTPPANVARQEAAVIEIRLLPNGALSQAPKVLGGSPDAAKSAVQALERCTPFEVTPTVTEFYPEWKSMVISFEAK